MYMATYRTIIWDLNVRPTSLTQYSISLAILADWTIVDAGVTTSIGLDIKIALPEGVIRWKIKLSFHDLHIIFPVLKELPPCSKLDRCPSASTYQRVLRLATRVYRAQPSSWLTPFTRDEGICAIAIWTRREGCGTSKCIADGCVYKFGLDREYGRV